MCVCFPFLFHFLLVFRLHQGLLVFSLVSFGHLFHFQFLLRSMIEFLEHSCLTSGVYRFLSSFFLSHTESYFTGLDPFSDNLYYTIVLFISFPFFFHWRMSIFFFKHYNIHIAFTYLRFPNVQTIVFVFVCLSVNDSKLFPSNFPAFKRTLLSMYIILFLFLRRFVYVQFSILQWKRIKIERIVERSLPFQIPQTPETHDEMLLQKPEGKRKYLLRLSPESGGEFLFFIFVKRISFRHVYRMWHTRCCFQIASILFENKNQFQNTFCRRNKIFRLRLTLWRWLH